VSCILDKSKRKHINRFVIDPENVINSQVNSYMMKMRYFLILTRVFTDKNFYWLFRGCYDDPGWGKR